MGKDKVNIDEGEIYDSISYHEMSDMDYLIIT